MNSELINVSNKRVGAILNHIQGTPAKMYTIAYFSKKQQPIEKKLQCQQQGAVLK